MNKTGRAKALMLAGTGSDVGKTALVAGLCRLARQKGLNIVPFKPQNMSNNAAVAQTDDGVEEGEIGRGQWLQAIAAGVRPHVDMNPVLLKPQGNAQAQVIVQGQVHTTVSARQYQHLKRDLLPAVLRSFENLCSRADLILVEGAGSVAEVNLREHDIANMGFAQETDVPVVLVGDIERGGVIASLVGSHYILPESDRRLIAGFLINKFRGTQSLFDAGIEAITHHTDWPCFGIVPWDSAFAHLPAEDSFTLESARQKDVPLAHRAKGFKIVVPILSHIANFDDLEPLEAEEGVELVWLRQGDAWPDGGDLVILTGNKSTLIAMSELEKNGWAEAIRCHGQRGGAIIGICGGFQMLGRVIRDPDGIEGAGGQVTGLGLLEIETVMRPDKVVRNVLAHDRRFGAEVQAYEIHLGVSHGADCAHAPFVVEGHPCGAATADGRIWGTYLHGLFANGHWRKKYFEHLGVCSQGRDQGVMIDYALDNIANLLEETLETDRLFALAR